MIWDLILKTKELGVEEIAEVVFSQLAQALCSNPATIHTSTPSLRR